MESSSNLKHDEFVGRQVKPFDHLTSGGYSWAEYHHTSLQDDDLVAAGFSWPPRSYSCSFCKREFRSAQALGGHMNVHRRDRARLRLSPELPMDAEFPKFKRKLVEAGRIRHDHLTMATNDRMRSEMNTPTGHFAAEKECLFEGGKACEIWKKRAFDGLELKMGLIDDSKEELDLELRLGRNN